MLLLEMVLQSSEGRKVLGVVAEDAQVVVERSFEVKHEQVPTAIGNVASSTDRFPCGRHVDWYCWRQ
jgi:hypothetical protein